jgi:phosphate transport system substrate-binding protein
LVTRKPDDQERGNLAYRVIARAPVVVAVNKALSITNVSEAQICDIFSGRVKSWKEVGGTDLRIQVLGRKKDDANLDALQKQMPCFAGLKITSEAILLDRGSEVDRSLAGRPGTIGVTDYESALRGRDGFKALTIEGASASADGTASARYPYFREFGVVTVGEPQGAVKRFLEFISGPESQKLLAQSGVVVGRFK